MSLSFCKFFSDIYFPFYDIFYVIICLFYDIFYVIICLFYDMKTIFYDIHPAENGGYPPTQNGDIRSLFWLFSLMALQN